MILFRGGESVSGSEYQLLVCGVGGERGQQWESPFAAALFGFLEHLVDHWVRQEAVLKGSS